MNKIALFIACLLSFSIADTFTQQKEKPPLDKRDGEITNLKFGQLTISNVNIFRTLQIVVNVTDDLYLMTHYGDLEGFFLEENQDMIDNPFINDRSCNCSVFSTIAENTVMMGRNWDNENVGFIIISL